MNYKIIALPLKEQLIHGISNDQILSKYYAYGYRVVNAVTLDLKIGFDTTFPLDEMAIKLAKEKNIKYFDDETYFGPTIIYTLERSFTGAVLYEDS